MKLSVIFLAAAFAIQTASAAKTGEAAPDFSVKNSKGETVKLSDYKGKTVVLEWLNHGCPFVKKHYGTGNMQKLQADATGKGVVWLSVISSAKGKQGSGTPAEVEAARKEHKSNASAILLDTDGTVGKAYAAKTTPHMYVIDAAGKLAYQGAIDDKPSTEQEDVKSAHNYVTDAIAAVTASPQKAVAQAETKPYGCSVKY